MDETRGAYHVQSLERGLAVIRAFDAGAPELTLSEVARATGLTRAAARRFLLTLVDLGYVRTDGKYFSLTARVLELGYAFLSSMRLPEVAQPHLERLSAEVRESSSVSVLDGTDIVYVARVAVSRIMTVTINVGTRFPAYATSMGHVLLAGLGADALAAYLGEAELHRLTSHTLTSPAALRAELAKVREQGWALMDQELEEGLRSVAAPIRDRDGTVVAAVNVSTQASRNTSESVREEMVPPLLAAAKRIEADLAVAPAQARESPAQARESPAGAREFPARCAGLLLAAGAGRRFGRPKALVELDGEPLLLRALRVLADGGCDPVRVVLGAQAEDARALLPDPSIAVYAPDWSTGMGASLRTGLLALPSDTAVEAVLVQLVDLPRVDARVISRLRALASPDVVARATYEGTPGHPVLFGRRWWTEIADGARGDRGARDWLATRGDLRLVDCSDLGSGADVDTPADLNP